MPTCRECGTHWFNSTIDKCPACGTLTVEGLACALSEKIRSDPCLARDFDAIAKQLSSDDPVSRKAVLDVLTKDQTRTAFDLLLSAARRTKGGTRYDILCALYYYSQYAEELIPFLLDVASERDDGSYCQSMALTVIGNLGLPAIHYLIDHRHKVPSDRLFWEAISASAEKLDESEAVTFIDFVNSELTSRELTSGSVDSEFLDSLIKLIEKPWFPADEFIEYAASRLDSRAHPYARNAAANVLFHCCQTSKKAKKSLAAYMRDDVLGIRCRAVQGCGEDADDDVISLLCAAANLESIVERGGGEEIWTKEQLVSDIEQTSQQSFATSGECLDWVRENCFVDGVTRKSRTSSRRQSR